MGLCWNCYKAAIIGVWLGGEVDLAKFPVSGEDFLPGAGFGFGEVEGGAVEDFGAEVVVDSVGGGAAGVGVDGGVWEGGVEGVGDGVAVGGGVAGCECGHEGVHCGGRCCGRLFCSGSVDVAGNTGSRTTTST